MKLSSNLYITCIAIFCLTVSISCNNKIDNKLIDKGENAKSITTILKDNVNLSIDDRILIYQRFKNDAVNKNSLEEEMNLYGYNLLWDGKKKEALAIFKLLVSDFPESANTYDSLAEVYLKLGEKEKALLNYKKAYAMDPDNFNAFDQIEMIEKPNQKKLSPQEKFHQQFTVDQYLFDLDELLKTIITVHPNALKFISLDELQHLVESKKEMITAETTFGEFSWMCSEIVASINCSHSNTNRFWSENMMLPLAQRFPMQTRLIDEKLYVTATFSNDDRVNVADEIESINDIKVKNLISLIYPHISSQGLINTSKRHEFNKWSTGMIAYALGFPDIYTIKLKEKSKAIVLSPATIHNDPLRNKVQEECGGDLCFNYLDIGKKIGCMAISSFNYYEWDNLSIFQEFVDNAMADMNNNKTDHLIIDVRGNGGGSPESSIHLLKYLLREPFQYYSKVEYPGKIEKHIGEYTQTLFKKRYNGELYFLIDGVGNSTTGHFMSIIKDHKLGTIIGEELGSNQFCSADRKRCRLLNTKLEYNLAINTHVSSATSFSDDVGILPDHYVTQSITEYLDGKDAVYDYTLDLLKQDVSWKPASKYHSSYFLNAEASLSKELFQVPLNFAPEMTLKGIEDARFLKGWRNTEGENFWSYSFAWNVQHTQLLSIDDINQNLEAYFNGLMRIKEKGKRVGVTESIATLTKDSVSNGSVKYLGEIKTLDGFFKQEPMTFKVKAEQIYCNEIERAIILFRFSPQNFEAKVWNRLEGIKLPYDICIE